LRRYLLPGVAAITAIVTFGFRFLTMRDFTNDHFMHLAWAQQILFGEVPGRDFVDPGFPLMYGLSALAQLAQPGPLSEGLLTITALSIAAAAVVFVVERVTGSLTAGAVAGLFSAAMQPQLYNYPKVIAPAIALVLLAWHRARPSRGRLAALAVWTTASFLFRYDLGLYVGVAMIAGLLVANWGAPRTAARTIGEYIAIGLITVLPYLAFLQWVEGVPEGIRMAVEFSKNETAPLDVPTPEFPFLGTWSLSDWNADDSTAFLFYFARALVPVAAILLIARRRAQRSGPAVMTAAIVLLATYDVIILRHPIVTRIRDLAAPMAVVGVWTGVEIIRAAWGGVTWHARVRQAAAIALVAVVGAGAFASVSVSTKLRDGIGDTHVLEGMRGIRARTEAVLERVGTWPWTNFWPTGNQPGVVQYIAQCTEPSARLLVNWFSPEYYFFTRRAFAAGHAVFLPPRAFIGERDQRLMIARLQREFVPLALINETRHDEFAEAYGMVDSYIREHYEPVGHYRAYDDSDIAISIRKDLKGTTSYGEEGWPCKFEPAG
jgi:hypothetical protein